MKTSVLEDIYYTLIGEMVPECRFPGVEDAFTEGSICDMSWQDMDAARNRILERLGTPEGDGDMDTVVDSLTIIPKELCQRMFRLGWAMGNVSAELRGEESI